MTVVAVPARAHDSAGTNTSAYWNARALVYATIVAFVVTSLPNAPSLALARWSGARILQGGMADAGPGWLGALCSWAIAFGGTAAALVAAAAGALVAFGCTEQRARLRGGRIVAIGAVVLAALCSFDALRAGGEATSAAFAATLALVLERGGNRRTLYASALAVVWCNVSPTGIIAPLIAICFAFGAAHVGGDARARRTAWLTVAGCAGATLITPAFVSYPVHAFAALGVDRALGGIVTLHPIDVAPAAYRVGFLLAVLAFFTFGCGTRMRVSDIALVAFATLLALTNGAYLAVFGVLVAPVVAGAAAERLERRDARDSGYGAGDVAVALAALALAVCVGVVAGPRADTAIALQPYALAKVAFAEHGPHRFYCADLTWCDDVLASGPRGTSVLLDTRVVMYSAEAREAQRTIAHAAAGWRAALDRQRIDALLVRRDRALATLLRLRGDWHAIASDEAAELFVRTRGRT